MHMIGTSVPHCLSTFGERLNFQIQRMSEESLVRNVLYHILLIKASNVCLRKVLSATYFIIFFLLKYPTSVPVFLCCICSLFVANAGSALQMWMVGSTQAMSVS